MSSASGYHVTYWLFVLLPALSLPAAVHGDSSVEIRCNLRHWLPSSKGLGIPAASLKVGGRLSDSYVVRAKLDSGDDYSIGTLDGRTDTAFFPITNEDLNTTGSVGASYEVLGNPEGCDTSWVQYSAASNPKKHPFSVRVDGSGEVYVGLVVLDGWNYVGEINMAAVPPVFTFAKQNETVEMEEDFQFLSSSSEGLRMSMELGEIQLFADGSEGGSVVGSEEVHNLADVTISQTFTHAKTFTEIFETSTSSSSMSSSASSVGFDLIIAGAKKSFEHKIEVRTQETWRTEKITDIKVTRTMDVPPYTSIRACSIVTLKDKINIPYEATVVYSAPGLEPQEIYDLIKAEGVKAPNVTIDGDQVVLKGVKGVFKGAVALDASFYVADLGEGGSCGAEQARAQQFKRDQVPKLRAQLLM